MSLKINQLTHR